MKVPAKLTHHINRIKPAQPRLNKEGLTALTERDRKRLTIPIHVPNLKKLLFCEHVWRKINIFASAPGFLQTFWEGGGLIQHDLSQLHQESPSICPRKVLNLGGKDLKLKLLL